MDRYELDKLSETFKRHGEEAEKSKEEMIIRWKNEYSSDKVPSQMTDTFNLPLALKSLVDEVIELRSKLDGLLG